MFAPEFHCLGGHRPQWCMTVFCVRSMICTLPWYSYLMIVQKLVRICGWFRFRNLFRSREVTNRIFFSSKKIRFFSRVRNEFCSIICTYLIEWLIRARRFWLDTDYIWRKLSYPDRVFKSSKVCTRSFFNIFLKKSSMSKKNIKFPRFFSTILSVFITMKNTHIFHIKSCVFFPGQIRFWIFLAVRI